MTTHRDHEGHDKSEKTAELKVQEKKPAGPVQLSQGIVVLPPSKPKK